MKLMKRHIYLIAGTILTMFLIIAASLMISGHFASYRENMTGQESSREKLIVLFNEDIDKEDLTGILAGYGGFAKIERHLGDYVLISVEDNRIYEDIENYLSNHPLVKTVQPDGNIRLMQTSDDVYSKTQWAIHNPGYYSVFSSGQVKEVSAMPDIDMDVTEAWQHMNQENTGRRQVVVAIIDTGVDYTHPDLSQNIWINKNEIPSDGIDNDNNGYVDDIYGWDFYNNDASVCHYRYDESTGLNLSLPEDNDDHGTHIAGIIGAVKDNQIGIAGIASNIDIKMMILKINGGPQGTGSISDAISAIKYATMMGADICNISWGTGQYSPALEEVIRESDMLFVAAAGNLGTNNDIKPVYPAGFELDNLISVTFIDANGNMTKKSNYGKTSVDIAAPGDDILSTVVGTYQTLSGSSIAAPQVSAIASLLYSCNENLYPLEVKNIIIKTLKPIEGLRNHMKYPGIPSAYRALLALREAKGDYIPPYINLITRYDKGNLLVPLEAADEGGSGIRVIRWLPGVKDIVEFGRGTAGLSVEEGKIKVAKAGAYTFYVSDYAGNETVQVYEVEDDITPPSISAGYTVADDYKTRTVTVKVKDSQSGIKRVKYMPGNRNASDFLPAGSGTEIKIKNNKGSFKVKNDGYYTIYAIDYRGNQTVRTIGVRTVVSREIKFTRSKLTMTAGDRYYLRAFVKPADTTDVITYSSSDESVVLVYNDGRILALAEGTATVTARTSKGLKVSCRIAVVKRE